MFPVRNSILCLYLGAIVWTVTPVHASMVFVNGGFEQTTYGDGQLGTITDALGWTGNGYNFIVAPGTADGVGSPTTGGHLKLWGPNNGSNNGLPATSPNGGNFIAADGNYSVGAISQTLTGLTPGWSYVVGFWWAGAQQYNFNGINNEQWTVSFGSQSQSTPWVQNASNGFTGWMYQTFTFQAGNASDTLSFLAAGTPTGVPPFALLDGVTVTEIAPETNSWLMVASGLAVLGVTAARRRAS